ncbi:MAG TPA: hypothetical protein VMS56_14855 [Thermoanaerobaculia bacterium]|nr:hypothetical protein [Thermoanaerobaculia bacterium]
MRPITALAFVCVLGTGCASVPDGGERYVEVVEGATRIGCRGTDGEGAFGSRLARGPMLVADAGPFAAWVEIEAKALRDGGGEGTCQNVSRLVISGEGATRVPFVQQPGWEGRNGNALELLDWSPDGTRLLLELFTWTYPTDVPDLLLLIWNARSGEIEQPGVNDALLARFGGDCEVRARGVGFTEGGEIVVAIEPTPRSARPGCVAERELRIFRRGSPGELVPAGSARVRAWSTRQPAPPFDPSAR